MQKPKYRCPRCFFEQRHSGEGKFRQDGTFKKKELSQKEQNRRAWREEKVIKDKKRAGLGNSWSGRGCPKWMKRHCNKKHRAWEKRTIFRENYEQLGTWNWKRKDIFDPWMWD